MTLSQKMRVRASTYYIYTVIDGVKRFTVCIKEEKCSCGQFQPDELPCPHTLTILRHRNESYETYCSHYYIKESLLMEYEITVGPLSDESKWDPQHIAKEVVLSPTGRKGHQRDLNNKYTKHMMKKGKEV
ncbi:uncharacterized protein LOC142169609 [Nicotiana tabacum]|uniref:Uncharacterized protein LOC142169609 n=1 Tax=Nicotiana tabacum TaxID=4097 RepID=A0AC58SRK6_TOBAC